MKNTVAAIGPTCAVGLGIHRPWLVGTVLLVTLLGWPHLAVAAAGKDPARIALSEQDLDGWTQTAATRQETWEAPPGPVVPTGSGDRFSYTTEFVRTTSDGRQLSLSTQAAEGAPDALDQFFTGLQHDGLGQPQIALPTLGSDGFAWWENAGPTRNARAAARAGEVVVVLRLDGVADPAEVSDDDVVAWLTGLVMRANAAPAAPGVDWGQLLPDRPPPWPLLLDAADVGSDWQQQTGLELTSREQGGSVLSVSASRSFRRTGAFQRTLSSTATVYQSGDAASAQVMIGPGAKLPAPSLGEQAAAFRMLAGGGREAATVLYTIDVRRGPLVVETQEEGVLASLEQADETIALADIADARAARLLSGP